MTDPNDCVIYDLAAQFLTIPPCEKKNTVWISQQFHIEAFGLKKTVSIPESYWRMLNDESKIAELNK